MYASPERLDGLPYGFPADVWAFGLCLLEIALGRNPIPSSSTDLLSIREAIMHGAPMVDGTTLTEGGQALSVPLSSLVGQCLRIHAADRKRAHELLDLLGGGEAAATREAKAQCDVACDVTGGSANGVSGGGAGGGAGGGGDGGAGGGAGGGAVGGAGGASGIQPKDVGTDAVQTMRVAGSKFVLPSRYKVLQPGNSWSGGSTVTAQDQDDQDEKVLIRKHAGLFDDHLDCKRLLVELKVMRHFAQIETILSVRAILPPDPKGEPWSDVYLVLEHMPTNLHTIIRSKQPLSDEHNQYLTYQLLHGLRALHTAGLVHRDLKPNTLLVNDASALKISGFESVATATRWPTSAAALTEYVVTRWYGPTELTQCPASAKYMHSMHGIKCCIVCGAGTALPSSSSRMVLMTGRSTCGLREPSLRSCWAGGPCCQGRTTSISCGSSWSCLAIPLRLTLPWSRTHRLSSTSMRCRTMSLALSRSVSQRPTPRQSSCSKLCSSSIRRGASAQLRPPSTATLPSCTTRSR